MKHPKGIKSIFAMLAALAVTLTGLIAQPAHANENINPNQKGSITVHKFDSSVTSTGVGNKDHDGKQIEGLDQSKALDGVTFTLYKVEGFDLTSGDTSDQKNWESIAAAKADENHSKATIADKQYDLKKIKDEVTANKGVAKFDQLEVGLYYVVESNVGNHNISQKASPFFVSIPLPQDKGWLYDVHAYPKNTDNGKKEAKPDTSTKKVGDKIHYVITRNAPASTEAKPLTAFGVVDLSMKNVTFDKDSVKVKVDGKELAQGEFKVENAGEKTVKARIGGSKNKTDELRNAYRISVIDNGLKKVAGKEVTFEYDVTVNSLVKNGEIRNAYYPITNEYDPFKESGDVPPPTEPVKDPYYGEYAFKKVAKGINEGLKGAKFSIYASEEDANAKANPIYTVESDEQGIVKFDGLYLGLFEKGLAEHSDVTKKDFWIAEDKAPAGYKLITNPIKVEITNGTVGSENTTRLGPNVDNEKADRPNLPLTGATGSIALVAIGLAVIGIAVGANMVYRRKTA